MGEVMRLCTNMYSNVRNSGSAFCQLSQRQLADYCFRAMPDFNTVISQSESKKHVPKDLQGLSDFQEYSPKTQSPNGSVNGITPERQRKVTKSGVLKGIKVE